MIRISNITCCVYSFFGLLNTDKSTTWNEIIFQSLESIIFFTLKSINKINCVKTKKKQKKICLKFCSLFILFQDKIWYYTFAETANIEYKRKFNEKLIFFNKKCMDYRVRCSDRAFAAAGALASSLIMLH